MRLAQIRFVGGYAVAQAISACAAFLSIPLIISALDDREFGAWSLLEPLIVFAPQFGSLGVTYGLLKLVSHDREPIQRVLPSLLMGSMIPVLSVAALSSFVAFGISPSIIVAGSVFFLVVLEGLLLIAVAGSRAVNGVGAYTVIMSTRALVFPLLIVSSKWFDGDLDITLLILFRLLASSLSLAIAATYWIPRVDWRLPLAGSYLTGARTYGAPLLITGSLLLSIEYVDRYILTIYSSFSEIGAYVAHVKYVSLINVAIINPFGLWWPTERFRRVHDPDGGKKFFKSAAATVALVLVLSCSTLFLLAPRTFPLIAPQVELSPITLAALLFGVLFLGMASTLNVGLLNANNPRLNILAGIVGAIVNVILCFIFIPLYGAAGAAIATAIGYLAIVIFQERLSEKIYPIGYPIVEIVILIFIGVMLSALLPWGNWASPFGIVVIALAVFAGMFGRITNDSDKN